jgi:hypothetical protein
MKAMLRKRKEKNTKQQKTEKTAKKKRKSNRAMTNFRNVDENWISSYAARKRFEKSARLNVMLTKEHQIKRKLVHFS